MADIKLRNINKEYILKRIEEVAGLEEEIADLQDIVNNPGRIKKLIMAELQAVKKKYAVPRRTEIVYEYQTAAAEDAEDETPDYPVHVFCSREGYFKKITPQSLRMSGEQKYKEGDGPCLQWEASNRDELLVFTDRQQCYKARLSDFDDTKASVLGDFLPTKLGMDAARASCGPVSPPTTPAICCSSLKTARWPGWPCRPIRPRPAARSSPAPTPTSPPWRRPAADRGHGDGGELHRGPGAWSSTPPP